MAAEADVPAPVPPHGGTEQQPDHQQDAPSMPPHGGREHHHQAHGQGAPPGFIPPMSAEDVAALGYLPVPAMAAEAEVPPHIGMEHQPDHHGQDAPSMPLHSGREHRHHANGQDAPPGFVPLMSAEDVAAVEAVLGYEFADKSLVEEALTHGSFYHPYRPGDTYERLEYLGDGVLTCLMSREVFCTYRSLPPGQLTKLRAANVDKEKLARVAVARGLHAFLRHKAPDLDGQINVFIEEMFKCPVHSNGLLDPPKILSDIVESLIGAIYFDSNFNQEKVWQVFRNLADPLISLETLGKHPMSELFEICQKTRRGVKIIKDEWDKNLKVDVLIDGELVGSATYAKKKEIAQNRAAKAALDKLKETMGQCGVETISVKVSKPDELNLAETLEFE